MDYRDEQRERETDRGMFAPFFADGERPADELTKPGDQLQSAASRLIEWVFEQAPPYEVHQAALEARDAINDWTEARRAR